MSVKLLGYRMFLKGKSSFSTAEISYSLLFADVFFTICVCLVAQMVNSLPAVWGNLSWIPGSGRSPRERNGYPLQYSCLENSMDRGAWWAI